MSFIQARFRICRFDVFSKDLQERAGAMRVKMGTVVPKMGTIVHLEAPATEYRQAIASALIEDLGMTHRAIKTAMAWTGASERTVKYWLAADRGPSGEHLIALARHSDAVFLTILLMTDRLVDEDGDAM